MTLTVTPKATARIPLLEVHEMSEVQRALYDNVVAGPRGQMIGPLRAAIHSPDLAQLWSKFGEFLRYNTSLPHQLSELAILVTGRRWNSQVEWWAHAKAGQAAGLQPAVIDAIQAGIAPAFTDEASWEVYEFARQLQATGTVSTAIHSAIVTRWGIPSVVELTAVIGYYTMVAMTLNAHELPLPEGVDKPLPPHPGLFELAPAQFEGAQG